MGEIGDIQHAIQQQANPEKALFLKRFFKTEKGEYGEGDVFLGLTVPQSRKIAKAYKDLSLSELKTLLQSKIHEERLIALFILTHQFTHGGEKERKDIYSFYLNNKQYVNNWDLVDSSADKIVGGYLADKPRHILDELARSESIWDRRIAIMATYYFIKVGEAETTLKIAEILRTDKHDLIQKAVGWMLREVGKRVSLEQEEAFLRKYSQQMGRTMLRYAIERFPEEKRKAYLLGKVTQISWKFEDEKHK